MSDDTPAVTEFKCHECAEGYLFTIYMYGEYGEAASYSLECGNCSWQPSLTIHHDDYVEPAERYLLAVHPELWPEYLAFQYPGVTVEEITGWAREQGLDITPEKRLCACGCERPITSPRPEAKYATGACRVRALRQRQAWT